MKVKELTQRELVAYVKGQESDVVNHILAEIKQDGYFRELVIWAVDKVRNMDPMDLTEMLQEHMEWDTLDEFEDTLLETSRSDLITAILESEHLELPALLDAIERDGISDDDEMYYCPECGWDSTMSGHAHNANVTVKDFKKGDGEVLQGCTWIEVWTCPDCATVFEFPNGK